MFALNSTRRFQFSSVSGIPTCNAAMITRTNNNTLFQKKYTWYWVGTGFGVVVAKNNHDSFKNIHIEKTNLSIHNSGSGVSNSVVV